MPSNSSSALSPPTAPLLLKNSSVAPLKHDGHHLDIFLFVLNTDNYDKIREIINTNKYNQHLEEKKKMPVRAYHMRYIYGFLFFSFFFFSENNIWLSLQNLVSGQSIRITQ